MRKETDESAARLREFEEQHKIIDLESQSKAVVSAMASLRSQEISKELQLNYMDTFSSRDEASVSQLRQQLAVMNAKFHRMEEEPTVASDPGERNSGGGVGKVHGNSPDIFPPALSVPKLRFQLEQLVRDRKLRETDLLLLMQRLEMAKVNEARDTSAFQVLDHPALPTYRSWPKVYLVLIAGVMAGLMVTLVWTLGPLYLRLLSRHEQADPGSSR
jgi:uncharacterized protein involved in exopolysaccharide biosynthesis